MKPIHIIIISLTAMLITACTPDFGLSKVCASNQDAAVRVTVEDFTVIANEPGNEYILYLQDILNALKLAEGEVALSSDEQAAMDAILAIVNREDFLNYNIVDGVVVSATNPLDFLENLIATTDSNKVIDAFSLAKKQMAAGIADDDGFCTFTNRNIIISNLDNSIQLFAELFMSYSPFTRIVQTNILITKSVEALNSIPLRAGAPFVGFLQTGPEKFKSEGYTQPSLIRQSIVNNLDRTQNLIIDDDFDSKIGLIEYLVVDTDCDQENDGTDPRAVCPDGIPTRTVQKSQCLGGGVAGNGNPLPDDLDKREVRSFDLSTNLTGLKRVRVETDYPKSEVRIYTSKYNQAIENFNFDEDAGVEVSNASVGEVDVIFDPTNCEKQVVLDELALARKPDLSNNTLSGVRLTLVPDPGYDFEDSVDADGNDIQIEPIPAFSYTGITIPSRI